MKSRVAAWRTPSLVELTIVSPDQNWLEVNEQLCVMLDRNELELMATTWNEMTHADDREADAIQFDQIVHGITSGYTTEKRFLRKDGTVIYASLSVRCLRNPDGTPDCLVVLIQDVTKRTETEHALRESERQLLTLMGNLPGIAYRCRNDADYTMEFVSEGCRALTGYDPADLILNQKLSYASLIHPDDWQEINERIEAALKAKQPFQLLYRVTTASGEERWFWEQGVGLFSEADEPTYLEGFITDVTEQIHARGERAVDK